MKNRHKGNYRSEKRFYLFEEVPAFLIEKKVGKPCLMIAFFEEKSQTESFGNMLFANFKLKFNRG